MDFGYLIHIATSIAIYSVIIITQNMILGYLGILYLAHPAIYGIGAYTYTILLMKGVSFFPSIFAAGFVSMIVGILLALPTIKLRSHYIGMTTLAFLGITHGVLINWTDLTRGALGIPGIPRPVILGFSFSSPLSFFLLVLTLCVLISYLLYKILHSPFSKVIEMIREDETAAISLGKNTIKYKIQVFAITTFFGGIMGGLLASFIQFIHPNNYNMDQLILVLAMVIVGGMASFWGSILGAAIITLIPEMLRYLKLAPEIDGALRFAIFGLLIILFMLFKPNGLLGKRTNVFSK